MRINGLIASAVFTIIILSGCGISDKKYRQNEQYRSETYLLIQPIGINNIPFKKEMFEKIKQDYAFKDIVVAKNISPPDTFINYEKGKRYSASMLLDWLELKKPDSCMIVVGLTDTDIFITKRNRDGSIKQPEIKYKVWGIFGLGQRPGSSCIVSTHRIKHSNNSVYKDRLIKIVLHEIGHNMGLKHCPDKDCYMTDAVETISTIDNASLNMCINCKKEITKG